MRKQINIHAVASLRPQPSGLPLRGRAARLYALFGGLKGVAISDTLNGVGLLIGGAMVFFIGV